MNFVRQKSAYSVKIVERCCFAILRLSRFRDRFEVSFFDIQAHHQSSGLFINAETIQSVQRLERRPHHLVVGVYRG